MSCGARETPLNALFNTACCLDTNKLTLESSDCLLRVLKITTLLRKQSMSACWYTHARKVVFNGSMLTALCRLCGNPFARNYYQQNATISPAEKAQKQDTPLEGKVKRYLKTPMKSFIWHSKATRVHPLPSPPPLSSNPRGSRKTINREPINNLTSKNQPTHQSLNQSTNQSINQSTIPSIKQSVHQPTNQPTNQSRTASNDF